MIFFAKWDELKEFSEQVQKDYDKEKWDNFPFWEDFDDLNKIYPFDKGLHDLPSLEQAVSKIGNCFAHEDNDFLMYVISLSDRVRLLKSNEIINKFSHILCETGYVCRKGWVENDLFDPKEYKSFAARVYSPERCKQLLEDFREGDLCDMVEYIICMSEDSSDPGVKEMGSFAREVLDYKIYNNMNPESALKYLNAEWLDAFKYASENDMGYLCFNSDVA